MKKILLLALIGFLAVSGCKAIQDFFAKLYVNKDSGTTEEEFVFTVDTNDAITGWYVDGVARGISSRSAVSEALAFNEGSHTISISTENGASDSVEIYVYSVSESTSEETVVEETSSEIDPFTFIFNVDLTSWTGISDVKYESPILQYGLCSFDLSTMDPVSEYQITVEDTESGREISLLMGAYEWLIFEMGSEKCSGLTESEFLAYLETLYSKEEPVYEWASTVFSLTGHTSTSPDTFSVDDSGVTISGETTLFDDLTMVIEDDVRILYIDIKVDTSDATIFYGSNLQNFFGMDDEALSLEELQDVAEILYRYPEENILNLSEEFYR